MNSSVCKRNSKFVYIAIQWFALKNSGSDEVLPIKLLSWIQAGNGKKTGKLLAERYCDAAKRQICDTYARSYDLLCFDEVE